MAIAMLPVARTEMIRASRWYDRKSAGLGDRLLDDIRMSILAIKEFPAAFPPIGGTRSFIELMPVTSRSSPLCI